eukprot:CAMPEP_0184645226 /NCGR_PEP_ID=MMETSP0308-20130426/1736_1 /TAXON_ID=38269 /ORGANISM="Gloeochaete witrockiana, Strain SAG 46.84" /LENGTH=224 /DNA_ID=CAMNT_0027074093 /DNA_START=94 /DNA_END=765 /DNA_ORIENTATION=-
MNISFVPQYATFRFSDRFQDASTALRIFPPSLLRKTRRDHFTSSRHPRRRKSVQQFQWDTVAIFSTDSMLKNLREVAVRALSLMNFKADILRRQMRNSIPVDFILRTGKGEGVYSEAEVEQQSAHSAYLILQSAKVAHTLRTAKSPAMPLHDAVVDALLWCTHTECSDEDRSVEEYIEKAMLANLTKDEIKSVYAAELYFAVGVEKNAIIEREKNRSLQGLIRW